MAGLFDRVHDKVHSTVDQLTADVRRRLGSIADVHSHTHLSRICAPGFHEAHAAHRFKSFAPERRGGNEVKWHVDGCGYMYAVSVALERATTSVWIMDWWLSPELYLRRPPAKNEEYRLDMMLKAAAERGVKVNVIVYKEVCYHKSGAEC
jgi:phospholipase D1/2